MRLLLRNTPWSGAKMQSKFPQRFEQFIREKQYVTNVSQCTLSWYRQALRWFPCEHPTQRELQEMVIRMREKGLKETAVNSYITCFNSYLHWDSGTERACGGGCTCASPKFYPETK